MLCSVCCLFLSMENGNKVNVLAQFQAESGDNAGPPIELPIALARDKLQQILNALLQQVWSLKSCYTQPLWCAKIMMHKWILWKLIFRLEMCTLSFPSNVILREMSLSSVGAWIFVPLNCLSTLLWFWYILISGGGNPLQLLCKWQGSNKGAERGNGFNDQWRESNDHSLSASSSVQSTTCCKARINLFFVLILLASFCINR